MELLAVVDWTPILMAVIVLTNTIATGVLAAWVRQLDRRAVAAERRAAERRGRDAERAEVAVKKRKPVARKPKK